MEEKNYKSRGEMVGETLKQEILDLRLKPGQMISENDVCDRFGVSRTPVREALRLLHVPGDGPVVLDKTGNPHKTFGPRVLIQGQAVPQL